MNSFHKPQKDAFFAAIGLLALLLYGPAAGFSPDAEAVLEHLRERIAAGLSGEAGYQAMLDLLSGNPGADCEEGPGQGDEEADGLAEAWAAVCPIVLPEPSARTRGDFRGRARASQSVRPRRGDNPIEAARGTVEIASPYFRGDYAWRGSDPGRRSVSLGGPRLAITAGHITAALAPTRLGCVAGARFYAGGAGTSGVEGPFASAYSGLDGLALATRAAGWELRSAGAWNRLPTLGNLPATLRRDAGLFLAGAGRETGAFGAKGAGFRAQAMVLRLDPGSEASQWLPVAGAAATLKGGQGTLRVTGAASWFRGVGTFGEALLKGGEESWSLRLRQASPGWANPLQAPLGRVKDTLADEWITTGGGEGGLAAASAFPLFAPGAWRGGIQAGSRFDWTLEGFPEGSGNAALLQSFGPWHAATGASLASRRMGSSGTPAGWGQSLEWQGRAWNLRTACSGRWEGYSGTRPRPISLACAHRNRASEASLEWSTGDFCRPTRYQRVEVRQGWPAGNGLRVEQRLRVPWTPGGMAGEFAYQLALSAEF